MATLMHKDKAKALWDLLSWAHSEQYRGTDDMMIDDCNDWIGSLTDDEVAQICISTFREGI